MEHFFSQYPEVAYIIVASLVAIIIWMIKMAVKSNSDIIKSHAIRMDSQSKRMDSIEDNYKDEFKKIRIDANIKHLEVLGILTEVRVEIAQIKSSNIQINKQ